jgi:hypothetical protein
MTVPRSKYKRLTCVAALAVRLYVAMFVGTAFAGPLEDAWAAYTRKDYATALQLWRPLADQGNAHARYRLGVMYYTGQGVAQDEPEAMKWFRLIRSAAEQGDADAQLHLGDMFAQGQGVPRDYAAAVMWFTICEARSADQSVKEAASNNAGTLALFVSPVQITEVRRLARDWSLLSGERKTPLSKEEFGSFMKYFYLKPDPSLVSPAIELLRESGIGSQPAARAPLLMAFSCTFSQFDELNKNKWKAEIATLTGDTHGLLSKAIVNNPETILNAVPSSPGKNDMNWQCFFATGDMKYLNDITRQLAFLNERRDANLFFTAASAKWSLASVSKTHSRVSSAIEAMRVGDVVEMRSVAQEILTKSPKQIQDETSTIVKTQREKGIW